MAKPRKINSKSKVKTLDYYQKVGRLRSNIAKSIGVKCADIYISDSYIEHIKKRHGKELAQLGMSAIDFVKFVITNFNQVRKGSNNSLLLVVYGERKSKVAAISLNYSLEEEGFWEVKTAQPRLTTRIENFKILWNKK